MAEEAKWYVVHTYSGYENKVKANIEKIVENRKLQDMIIEIVVPMHHVLEDKNDIKKEVKKKTFPGYVIIKMVMTNETWYVVRNTRGVTGFVGPDSKPVALSDREIRIMGLEYKEIDIDVAVGDRIAVLMGPFEGSTGVVTQLNEKKRTLIVNLSIFGRDTPVEIDFDKIEVI